RHLELLWAAAILGLWVVGLPLSGWLLVGLLWPSLLIALVPWIRDRGPGPQVFRTACAFLARWCGRLLFAFGLYLIANVAAGQDLQSDSDDPADSGEPGSPYGSYDPYASSGSGESDDSGLSGAGDALGSFAGLGGDEVETWHGWLALAVFALIALCEAARRGQFARVLSAELSPQRFPDVANDPAEHGEGARFRRLRDLIRREQHAPLIMYDEAAPFRGAGEPYDTWVLTVELRPDAA